MQFKFKNMMILHKCSISRISELKNKKLRLKLYCNYSKKNGQNFLKEVLKRFFKNLKISNDYGKKYIIDCSLQL